MAFAGATVLAKRRVLWTPTWSNVTQGDGAINEGYYVERADGWVDFAFRLQFGTSPSFSSTIQIDLPFESWTGSGTEVQLTIGGWTFRDTGSGHHYSGSLGIWSSAGTSVSFNGAWDGTAPRSRITNAVPATVAVNDVLSGNGSFLLASEV